MWPWLWFRFGLPWFGPVALVAGRFGWCSCSSCWVPRDPPFGPLPGASCARVRTVWPPSVLLGRGVVLSVGLFAVLCCVCRVACCSCLGSRFLGCFLGVVLWASPGVDFHGCPAWPGFGFGLVWFGSAAMVAGALGGACVLRVGFLVTLPLVPFLGPAALVFGLFCLLPCCLGRGCTALWDCLLRCVVCVVWRAALASALGFLGASLVLSYGPPVVLTFVVWSPWRGGCAFHGVSFHLLRSRRLVALYLLWCDRLLCCAVGVVWCWVMCCALCTACASCCGLLCSMLALSSVLSRCWFTWIQFC